MKKICSLLLLMLLVMASCQHQSASGSKKEGVVFDSVVVDSTTRLNADTETPNGELSIRMVYAKPLGDDPQSVEAAWKIDNALLSSDLLMSDYMIYVRPSVTKGLTPKGYMEKALGQVSANFGKRYLADNMELFKEMADFSPTYNRSYTVHTKVHQVSDSIVNYVADTYYYDGGAHGQSVTWARNFNPHTGAAVTLADILRPGYEAPLTMKIMTELIWQFKVKNLQELQDSACVFMDMAVYIPKNYIIGSKGITFIYCQDEVAPHAAGEIRVTLTNKQLAELKRKK